MQGKQRWRQGSEGTFQTAQRFRCPVKHSVATGPGRCSTDSFANFTGLARVPTQSAAPLDGAQAIQPRRLGLGGQGEPPENVAGKGRVGLLTH